ncbi:MAG: uroporphyrinogen decarboxylase family protein [Dehalococcoidia bacterium]
MTSGGFTEVDAMLARDRVLMALNHEEPDRVPIDLGSTPVTGICRHAYADLLNCLGLSGREIEIADMVQQLAGVDEDVLQALDVDFRPIKTNPPASYRLEVRLEGDYETYYDQWGAKLGRPKGRGHYFDYLEYPIKQSTLEALEGYSWPDPNDPSRYEGLRQRARSLRERTPYALVGTCDLGTDILARPQWIRGYAASMLDLAANPDFAEAFLERLTQIAVQAWNHFLAEVGDYLDVAAFYDDLGMQDRPLISPAMYRRLVKPRHARIIETIKKRTKAKVFMHSCGAVGEFIPDMIEIGVDILNPIQVSAAGMGDTAELKRRYRQHLTFWGGTCDSQRVLPFGTLAEIREEARRRIADLAPGGGFVFAPIHNIQDDVSGQKTLALYRTALKHGRYPISRAPAQGD